VTETELAKPQIKVAAPEEAAALPALNTHEAEAALDKQRQANTLLKSLPNAWLGFSGVVFAMIVFTALSSFIVHGSGRSQYAWQQLITLLPLQLYLASAYHRISQVMGAEAKSKPPLSAAAVAAISLISFGLTRAIDPDYLSSLWLSPLFWLWSSVQVAFPVSFGLFMSKRDTGHYRWQTPAFLALCSALYLPVSFIFPPVLSASPLLLAFWFGGHFWLIGYLSGKMRKSLKTRVAAAKRSTPLDKDLYYEGDMLVVRYRAFAGIERWIKHRLKRENLKEGARMALMWIGGPVAIILTAITLSFISMYWKGWQATTQAAAAASQTSFNLAFIQYLLMLLAGGFAGGAIAYLSKPTHVCFGPQGIRFLWRHKTGHKDGELVRWSQIKHIGMERPAGKTSPLDDVLTFVRGAGSPLCIGMNSVDSVESREAILNAIQKWAGETPRDDRVIQALQPPADYSYTELWLQALAAPPKRERLKPLIQGALLRDGAYMVHRSLGVGGQGQAYLATDRRNGQDIVLKEFILPVYVDVSVRRTALEQFENEARILRQLEHPQIVRLCDFFVEDHRAYLVLEHIEGASLRQLVEQGGRLPEQQVRALAAQMCDILSYLHALQPPVVHRDFTPDNLILGSDGRLRLIDFNVAKQVENTTVGTVVGKHAYLPPEQFRGMPVPQSDIYAMGATLFYLLVGRDPEPISTSHPLLEVNELSQQINSIVEKATALSEDKRYRRIEDLRSDLDRADG
jgi:tRNA A-37 threonylcarbamoyl transferase component Bud32